VAPVMPTQKRAAMSSSVQLRVPTPWGGGGAQARGGRVSALAMAAGERN